MDPRLLALLQPAHPVAKFTQEGPQYYQQALLQNQQYAKPGPWTTTLSPALEALFRRWVKEGNIRFDPDAKRTDYDMRGFFKAMVSGHAAPYAGGHFPDTFKTPLDTTFGSSESMYAKPNSPMFWDPADNLVDFSTGQVVSGKVK